MKKLLTNNSYNNLNVDEIIHDNYNHNSFKKNFDAEKDQIPKETIYNKTNNPEENVEMEFTIEPVNNVKLGNYKNNIMIKLNTENYFDVSEKNNNNNFSHQNNEDNLNNNLKDKDNLNKNSTNSNDNITKLKEFYEDKIKILQDKVSELQNQVKKKILNFIYKFFFKI